MHHRPDDAVRRLLHPIHSLTVSTGLDLYFARSLAPTAKNETSQVVAVQSYLILIIRLFNLFINKIDKMLNKKLTERYQ